MSKTIAVLGGTGSEGSGLAYRWAHAGYHVIIGSRTDEKAIRVAGELNELLGEDRIQGMANEDAAAASEWIVLTVPYGAHQATIESVAKACQGKIFVDVTVPMAPPITEVTLPAGRTAAEEAQAYLGETVQVVSAFQNVSAAHLKDLNHEIDCDVLVASNSKEAKSAAMALIEATGMQGVDVGSLANAIIAESLTPALIHVNKTYKAKGAGIRITGINT